MNILSQNNTDFFVVGGSLRPNTPSYVYRFADDELFENILSEHFCYVLTSRQMGKSSLMTRTAARLKEQNVKTAIVDLTLIGTHLTSEQWYLGILKNICEDLKISVDVIDWWQTQSALSAVQRFTIFLRNVVLEEINEKVVIFVDEIDTTLSLKFDTDDFFAAIRAVYNARANDPIYNRLTFVLFGVATPSDLIKDKKRTPFNIGQNISLKEFSRKDAIILEERLEKIFPDQGIAIFDRIFYWTEGHPYLTQKLCFTISEDPSKCWNNESIDTLVTEIFLSTEASKRETNLQFIQSSIISSNDKRSLLNFYKRVLSEQPTKDDDRDPIQNQLKLIGLVSAKHGDLQVRNRIYSHVFDSAWIAANKPPLISSRYVATILALLLIILLPITGYLGYRQYLETQAQEYIRQGDNYYERGEYQSAVLEYSKAIQLEPDNYEYYWLRDKSLFEIGRLTETIDDYTKNIELGQSVIFYYNCRGNAYRISGDFETAVTNFDEAIKLDPKYVQSYLHRANAYRSMGKFIEALADYTLLIDMEPNNAEFIEARGYLRLYDLDEYEEAIADFDRLLELKPLHVRARFFRGSSYLRLENFELALEDFNEAVILEPDFVNHYWGRGSAYEGLGDLENAITDYTEAIDLDPQNGERYFTRAVAYEKIGDFENSIADYTRAIELNPNYLIFYINRASVYQKIESFENAIDDYSKAIELDTNNPNHYIDRGVLYQELGLFETATNDFAKAFELGSQNPNIYTLIGIALTDIDDYEGAIFYHTSAIELDPIARRYANRGDVYNWYLEDYETAIVDYTMAIQLDPTYAIYYNSRGDAYRNFNKFEEAISDYKYYLELVQINDPYYLEVKEKIKQIEADLK